MSLVRARLKDQIKLSPPDPQPVFVVFCCCCRCCCALFAIPFMLSPLPALAARAPMPPGGGAMLNELLFDMGGGGRANEFVAGFVGGGAMPKLEYGFCCCCIGGGAMDKFERLLDRFVLVVAAPHGFEVSDEDPLLLLQSTVVP